MHSLVLALRYVHLEAFSLLKGVISVKVCLTIANKQYYRDYLALVDFGILGCFFCQLEILHPLFPLAANKTVLRVTENKRWSCPNKLKFKICTLSLLSGNNSESSPELYEIIRPNDIESLDNGSFVVYEFK